MRRSQHMYRCPCCEEPIAEPGELRVHLMTRHRKSELAETIMAGDEEVPLAG